MVQKYRDGECIETVNPVVFCRQNGSGFDSKDEAIREWEVAFGINGVNLAVVKQVDNISI